MMKEDKNPVELEFISVTTNSNSIQPSTSNTKVKITPDSPAKASEPSIISVLSSNVTNAQHPIAAFFHIIFKALALFVYVFGSLFSNSFVFLFVLCILLLAFDFWTVKNITGRLLVGLRWWNRINEDGSSQWLFESKEKSNSEDDLIDPLDARVFWFGLYIAPVAWGLLLVSAILQFHIQWALVVVVAITLSGANIVGYTKCQKDAKRKMQNYVAQHALGMLGTSAGTKLMEFALGGGNSTDGKYGSPMNV